MMRTTLKMRQHIRQNILSGSFSSEMKREPLRSTQKKTFLTVGITVQRLVCETVIGSGCEHQQDQDKKEDDRRGALQARQGTDALAVFLPEIERDRLDTKNYHKHILCLPYCCFLDC